MPVKAKENLIQNKNKKPHLLSFKVKFNGLKELFLEIPSKLKTIILFARTKKKNLLKKC